MINKELIMKRLAAGEDAQVIADEMAKLINDAVAAHEEEMAAKAAAEAEAKELEARAQDCLLTASDYINAYVELKHPDLEFPALSAAELREIIEQSLPLLKMGSKVIKSAKKISKKDVADVDSILNEFLKAMKL